MSDQLFERAVREWLEDGSDRTPRPAIDAVLLAVKTTPQERDLRIPRRFPNMPALSRATGIAAVALVAAVGAGGIMYLASNRPGGPGSQGTPQPTLTPSPTASEVARGIPSWTPYTSEIHEFWLGYPSDWSVLAPATRTWQAGDEFPADDMPYADIFASPEEGDEQIGLVVWNMDAGRDAADLSSVENLKAWAQTFCDDVLASSCEAFTEQAEPLNYNNSAYGSAILVRTAGAQYAFSGHCSSCLLVGAMDSVTVVVLGREDGFAPAERYGGSVQLLKAILTTMDVWTVGPARPSGWITRNESTD